MTRITMVCVTLLVFGMSARLPAPLFAQTQGKVGELRSLVPAQTKVALLPVIDATGEKDDQRRDQANAVRMEMRDQFAERGFDVIDEEAVAKAIAEAKIDLSDEEYQRREPLYKVGKAVGADFVVFVVVTQAYSKIKKNLFGEQREGLAKTKTWLLDVKEEKPVLSGYVCEGKSTGSAGPFDKGNRSRMGAASGNSIRDVLNDVLKPYPRKKRKG
uniref:DUF4136 domain-containing protein n=1 Tax=uncultured Armatimonadetes bacterium TaxID=157466 RepID=A0A6J4I4J4_9BACT|nr:hypothetical protein AVDCRST_MAG63-1447 [uncultured Armatimonadetes bacterium]